MEHQSKLFTGASRNPARATIFLSYLTTGAWRERHTMISVAWGCRA